MKHVNIYRSKLCDSNLIPNCSNWLWKGFICDFWCKICIFDVCYIVLKTEREGLTVSFCFSSGFLEGLPKWNPECGGVQENLRQFLPLRWRVQVRRARLPNFWHQRRWYDRLPGVHYRLECDVTRQAGAEAEMGFQHVWSWWKRVHQPWGDAGDCAGEQGTLDNKNFALLYLLGAKDEPRHLCVCHFVSLVHLGHNNLPSVQRLCLTSAHIIISSSQPFRPILSCPLGLSVPLHSVLHNILSRKSRQRPRDRHMVSNSRKSSRTSAKAEVHMQCNKFAKSSLETIWKTN